MLTWCALQIQCGRKDVSSDRRRSEARHKHRCRRRASSAAVLKILADPIIAIIRVELESPEFARLEDRTPPIDKSGLHALQRASDIMWLAWAARASFPENLEYFLMISITNQETQQTILRAINSRRLDPWPGRCFSTFFGKGVEIAKALLGRTLD